MHVDVLIVLPFLVYAQVDLCWKHRIFAIIEGAFDPQIQVRQAAVWYGIMWFGMVRFGIPFQIQVQQAAVWYGLVWYHMVLIRFGVVWYRVWYGTVQYWYGTGMVCCGMVCCGMVWYGTGTGMVFSR